MLIYISSRPTDRFVVFEQFTSSQWYSVIPVGVNTLGTIVSRICSAAGFVGFYSSRSLRATCATRLFNAGVDERLIMAKTGHVSNSVRSYNKHISEEQLSDVDDKLAAKKAKPSDSCDDVQEESIPDAEMVSVKSHSGECKHNY